MSEPEEASRVDLLLGQLKLWGALLDCPDPLRLAAVAAEPLDACYQETCAVFGFDPLGVPPG